MELVYGATRGAGACRREVRAADRGWAGGVSISISSRECLLKPRT